MAATISCISLSLSTPVSLGKNLSPRQRLASRQLAVITRCSQSDLREETQSQRSRSTFKIQHIIVPVLSTALIVAPLAPMTSDVHSHSLWNQMAVAQAEEDGGFQLGLMDEIRASLDVDSPTSAPAPAAALAELVAEVVEPAPVVAAAEPAPAPLTPEERAKQLAETLRKKKEEAAAAAAAAKAEKEERLAAIQLERAEKQAAVAASKKEAEEERVLSQEQRKAVPVAAQAPASSPSTSSAPKAKTHGDMPLFLAQFLLTAAVGGLGVAYVKTPKETVEQVEETLKSTFASASAAAKKVWVQGEDLVEKVTPVVAPVFNRAVEIATPLATKAYEAAKPVAIEVAEKAVEAAKPLVKKGQDKAAQLLSEAQTKAKELIKQE